MSLSRNTLHQKIQFYSCLCIAFFLPLARLVPIFIVIMLLNWIVEGDYKNKFRRILRNKFALLFIAFYFIHLLGLIYTTNLDAGFFDIQVKASLFIFPMVIASRPFSLSDKQKIFYSFISGCILSTMVMLAMATYNYFTLGVNDFFYESFSSWLIHPSYFSMYLNVAIVWLIINVQRIKFSEKPFSTYSCYLFNFILFNNYFNAFL